MADNYVYIPETDSWEPIELDEVGFPLTADRVILSEAPENLAEETENLEYIETCKQLAESIPAPVGALQAIFDCDAKKWVVNESISTRAYYSSLEQEWPSWQQAEDGLWYAPVDPPEINKLHVWDEIAQNWHLVAPQPVTATVLSSQIYPSWQLGEDEMWHPPVLPPDTEKFYYWHEESLSWVLVDA